MACNQIPFFSYVAHPLHLPHISRMQVIKHVPKTYGFGCFLNLFKYCLLPGRPEYPLATGGLPLRQCVSAVPELLLLLPHVFVIYTNPSPPPHTHTRRLLLANRVADRCRLRQLPARPELAAGAVPVRLDGTLSGVGAARLYHHPAQTPLPSWRHVRPPGPLHIVCVSCHQGNWVNRRGWSVGCAVYWTPSRYVRTCNCG